MEDIEYTHDSGHHALLFEQLQPDEALVTVSLTVGYDKYMPLFFVA